MHFRGAPECGLDQYLRKQKPSKIDRDLIESIAKKKERSNVSLTTVNRILELIRAILNRAHKEWGWLDNTCYGNLIMSGLSNFLLKPDISKLL